MLAEMSRLYRDIAASRSPSATSLPAIGEVETVKVHDFRPGRHEALEDFLLRSGEVEAVKVHYLVPRRYKVVQKLLLGVLTSVDFRQSPELGVRTEDEVDTGAGPLEFARCAITTLEHVFVFRGCLPRRAHVEQIHEEVIGERLWPLGEDAVLGPSEVGHSGRACRPRALSFRVRSGSAVAPDQPAVPLPIQRIWP